jgi:DNA-binding SARP family transcriptional activator
MARTGRPSGSVFVNLLGGFRVAGPSPDDTIVLERKKSCALLAMLALDPDRTVTRGKLTAILWEDETETAARHRLRQCLLDLRHRLASVDNDTIRAEGDLIQLASSRFVVDVTRFEECAARGTRAALEAASGLYRGDLLDGFSLDASAFEEWLRVERGRLRSRAIAVMKGLLAYQAQAPYTEETIQVAIRLLALEPFDEAAHRTLMRLYAESGRRSAALRQYEECVELLGRELGVEPEPETRELYRRLVGDRSRPTTAATAGRAERGPATRAQGSRFFGRSPADTALVGREDDLAWLDGLARRAQHGQPQLAVVIGEAGIGKSRLVNELAARTRPRRTEVLFGRGREGEETLPFAPWIEALRPALTEDIFGRLPAVTRTDLSRLFVEFAGDSAPPSTGVDDGPRIFEAVAGLLRALSARQSTIVVLEDLHWSDDMTIRLLRFLPRRLESRRVLIVGTARPEDVIGGKTAHLDILCRDPSCVSRTLSPLSREDTTTLFEALLAQRADTSSAALLDRLWTLSEGNPFVIVECARAVRDQTVSDRDRMLDLPEGVRSLTVRSLARLSKRASRLADVAAVVGRDLDVKVLEHAARVSERGLADGLEELVLRRVLREFDGRFEFSHDRVREVAYRRLLEPRRVLLHRQIGDAMEALYAADLSPHSAIIGTHYRQAGDWPKACRHQAEAGFAALGRGAGREALTCFDHALEAIVRLPRTEDWRELEVRVRLASNSASMATGNYEGGRPYLLEAERVAETLADPRWRGRVAVALTSCVRAAGELESALTFGRRGLRIAEDTGDHGLEMAARSPLAMCEHNAGNFRRSLEYLKPVLGASGSRWHWSEAFVVDRPGILPALALYWTVFCCVQLGEFEHGRRLVVEALRVPDVENDVLQTRALCLHITHGRLLNAMGDFQAAIRAYQAGFAVYREDCHGNFYFPLAWGLGLAYALAGHVNESLAQFEEAKAFAVHRGTKAFSGMWLLHFGRALLAAERLDDAAQMAREALTVNSKNGERPGEAGSLGLLAEVAMRRDSVPGGELEDYALRALALAESMEMRPLAARCHLRLAWWYARTGRADAARHSAAAESLLDQMGRPRSLDAAGLH